MYWKSIIRSLAPPIIWKAGSKLLSYYHSPIHECEPMLTELEADFKTRNRYASPGDFVFRDGITLRLFPESVRGVEYFCFRSADMVAEMNAFLEICPGKKRFLDIGALHGIFSMAFAVSNPKSSVLAVDASALAFARLLYNLNKNVLINVIPVECALSNGRGKLHMHYEAEHAVATGGCSDNPPVLVDMTTGDALCESYCFYPDIIKIDVEGHEIKVLDGLRDTVKATRPVIFLEIHPGRIVDEGDSLDMLIEYLDNFDYYVTNVEGAPLALSELQYLSRDTRVVLRPK